jgi:hypothetical protein
MFAWFISLLMLFTNRSSLPPTASVGLNGPGSRHMLRADDTGTNPTSPASVDGGGKGGGDSN